MTLTYEVENLATLCSHEDVDVRRLAALTLCGIRDERSRSILIGLCSDKEDEIREIAAYALVGIENERALDYLTQRDNISILAASTIGEIGSNRALEFLISLSIDENKDVREMAASGLGLISNEKALATLIFLCGDEDEGVRISAGWSLARYDDSRVFDSVLSLCGDESEMVRIFVARNLAEMADTRWIDAFITLCRDKESVVRLWAVRGLRAIGGRRSLGSIISACYDTNEIVRQEAAAALGEIGGDIAQRELESLSSRSCINVFRLPRWGLASSAKIFIRNALDRFIRALRFFPIDIPDYVLESLVEGCRENLVSKIAAGLAKSGRISAFFVLESFLKGDITYLAVFPWNEHRLIQKRCRRAFLPYEWTLKEKSS